MTLKSALAPWRLVAFFPYQMTTRVSQAALQLFFTIGSILPKPWQVVIDCFKCSVFSYSRDDSLAFQTVSQPGVSNMLLQIKAFVNVKASVKAKGV